MMVFLEQRDLRRAKYGTEETYPECINGCGNEGSPSLMGFCSQRCAQAYMEDNN